MLFSFKLYFKIPNNDSSQSQFSTGSGTGLKSDNTFKQIGQ